MKNNSNEFYELDLIQWLQALWQKSWAILLVALACAVAAFSISSFLMTPLYEAEVLMYVNNSSVTVGNNNSSSAISNSELSAAQSLVETYIIILNSRSTLNSVIEQAGLDYSYSGLKKMLRATAVNGTEVFSVKVTSADPREAERIANTITRVLPKEIASVVYGSDVKIIDYAVIPSSKASPNVTLYTALGFFIGFFIMCLIITIQKMMDTLIHSEDYLLETYELPILAVVPELINSKSSGYYSSYSSSENKEVKR